MKRLIDANAFLRETFFQEGIYPHEQLKREIENQPTADAVEVEKYKRLVEMYHQLRENFVDYVCSGIRNEAPYCLNKCEYCVDGRGWCKVERCQGFNPAEVILDEERKGNG